MGNTQGTGQRPYEFANWDAARGAIEALRNNANGSVTGKGGPEKRIIVGDKTYYIEAKSEASDWRTKYSKLLNILPDGLRKRFFLPPTKIAISELYVNVPKVGESGGGCSPTDPGPRACDVAWTGEFTFNKGEGLRNFTELETSQRRTIDEYKQARSNYEEQSKPLMAKIKELNGKWNELRTVLTCVRSVPKIAEGRAPKMEYIKREAARYPHIKDMVEPLLEENRDVDDIIAALGARCSELGNDQRKIDEELGNLKSMKDYAKTKMEEEGRKKGIIIKMLK